MSKKNAATTDLKVSRFSPNNYYTIHGPAGVLADHIESRADALIMAAAFALREAVEAYLNDDLVDIEGLMKAAAAMAKGKA
jgi:hypothetical protein